MTKQARTKWFLPLLAVVLAGCVTTSRIDWASRVGNYTYDQAVAEFGPPDKAAKLSDGATVAEWQERPEQIIVKPGPYFARRATIWVFHTNIFRNPLPGPLFAADFRPGRTAQAVQGIRQIKSAFVGGARVFYSPRER